MQLLDHALSHVPRAFDKLVRLKAEESWIYVLLCMDAAGLIDLISGPDLWLGPVYLLVMSLATWSLGWRAGQAVGVACMALTFAINGLNLYPYGGANFAWNLCMRFLAVSLVIGVIAGMRRTYVREWWLARSDLLTGAFNRQAFFELAPRATSNQKWRLLIYADLDGLKKINDIQGHACGDACLREFGRTIRKVIRRDDLFARMGGDEFVLLFSVKDENAARAVASRLHKAMNSVPAQQGSVKCSVGGLLIPPGKIDVDDFVRRADKLMYEAKLRGACLELGVAYDFRAKSPDLSKQTPVPTGGKVTSAIRTERRSNAARGHIRDLLPR